MTKRSTIRNILLLAALLALLTACAPPVELSQTFTSRDETFTFNYPESWTILQSVEGTVFLSNQAEMLEADVALAEGVCVLAVMVLPAELIANEVTTLPMYAEIVSGETPTVQELTELMLVGLETDDSLQTSNLNLGGQLAYQVVLPADLTNGQNDSVLLTMALDNGGFIFSQTSAAIDGVGSCIPITQSIFETIDYTPEP